MEKTPPPVKEGYYGYPEAKEGPNTTYSNHQASNPVLRGIPLAIAGSLYVNCLNLYYHILIYISSVTHLNAIPSFLWSNAGFNSLRKLDLEDYEPRYDPTVIPKAKNESTTAYAGSGSTVDHAVYINGPKGLNRHYYTIADYHSAYESGKLTPTAVAQALLDLVPKHKAAFLDVKKDQVLAAAEASTQRYKDGNSRSMLDGVPVSVKGMLPMLINSTRALDLCTRCYIFTPILRKKRGINDLYCVLDPFLWSTYLFFRLKRHN